MRSGPVASVEWTCRPSKVQSFRVLQASQTDCSGGGLPGDASPIDGRTLEFEILSLTPPYPPHVPTRNAGAWTLPAHDASKLDPS